MLKKILYFSALIFCFYFTGLCFAQDKIVAVVNKEIITQKDLSDFVNFMRMQLSREYDGGQLEERMRALQVGLLDKLIEDRLILQEAKRQQSEAAQKKDLYTVYRLTIDENRIKARVTDIKKRYPSENAFQEDLARQGMVQADMEAKIKEQMLMYNIVELEVRDKVRIRPDEVTRFYEEAAKEFTLPEERELEVIAFENADLALGFAYSYQRGEKLTDLAARYPLTVNDMKVSGKGELMKDIEDAVLKLGINEVSSPLSVEGKTYVFRLKNIISARQQALSEVQEKIHDYLYEKKMQEGLVKWIAQLRTKAYIKLTNHG
ncbi:MAG: peptidyl-prolyl cis-trans isomerase [Candidatus Omnitrophota bacterium]